MRIRCPSCAWAVSTTRPHAVSAASGTPAASTWESALGLRATESVGTTAYCAYVPPERGKGTIPNTSVPAGNGCVS